MKIITDKEVEKILLEEPYEYVEYIHRRVREVVPDTNMWLKDKIIYDDPFHAYGDIRPMTCFTDRVKIVKVISTNPFRVKHPSVSVGATLLLDQEENFPTHIFEATAMSGIRTAAMVMWAISAGSTMRPINSILVVGNGRVGKYIKTLLEASYTFDNIGMLDADVETAKKINYDQDIVITATNSKEPFITSQNCTAKQVISVGADTHFNHELSYDFLKGKNIYVDIEEAKEVGDLESAPKVEIAGTMFDLYKQGDVAQLDVFISVGSALMDALTIEYIMGM